MRGIEGAKMKATYRLVALQIGITWQGRRYDRARPMATDLPNQALNHAASAVEAAAAIAVAATATIPQLGFIHEDAGQSFVLDIADLFRDSVTIPRRSRRLKPVRYISNQKCFKPGLRRANTGRTSQAAHKRGDRFSTRGNVLKAFMVFPNTFRRSTRR